MKFEQKVAQFEDQLRRNDTHHLFKTVTELEGRPKKVVMTVKDLNGKKHFNPYEVLDYGKNILKAT